MWRKQVDLKEKPEGSHTAVMCGHYVRADAWVHSAGLNGLCPWCTGRFGAYRTGSTYQWKLGPGAQAVLVVFCLRPYTLGYLTHIHHKQPLGGLVCCRKDVFISRIFSNNKNYKIK